MAAPTPIPASDAPPPGPGRDDPVIAAHLAARRRRGRRHLLLGVIPFPLLVGLSFLGPEDADGPLDTFLLVAFVLAFVAAVAAVLSHPMRTREDRRVRAVLASPWGLVQVYAAQPPRGRVGVVVEVSEDGAPGAVWLDESAPARRWPPPGVRTWAWRARSADRRDAVLCAPDRTGLRRVVRTGESVAAAAAQAWAQDQVVHGWRFTGGAGALPDASTRVQGEAAALTQPAVVADDRRATAYGRLGPVGLALALVLVVLSWSEAEQVRDRYEAYRETEANGVREEVAVLGVRADDGRTSERALDIERTSGGARIAIVDHRFDPVPGQTVVIAEQLTILDRELVQIAVVVGHVPAGSPWAVARPLLIFAGVAGVAGLALLVARGRLLTKGRDRARGPDPVVQHAD